MKKPEWHNFLEPREAVIAGVVGLAAMWALGYYDYNLGYIFWDLTPFQRKEWGTLMMVLGFAVPYCLVKWLVRRR
jgi:multisubunit Na+/H+ antiporter MnhB subunit